MIHLKPVWSLVFTNLPLLSPTRFIADTSKMETLGNEDYIPMKAAFVSMTCPEMSWVPNVSHVYPHYDHLSFDASTMFCSTNLLMGSLTILSSILGRPKSPHISSMFHPEIYFNIALYHLRMSQGYFRPNPLNILGKPPNLMLRNHQQSLQ